MLALRTGLDDVVGNGRPLHEISQHIGEVGEVAQPFQQLQRRLALLTGVLEDAVYTGVVEGLPVFFSERRIGDHAGEEHFFEHLAAFLIRGAFLYQTGDSITVDSGAWGEAVGLEDQGIAVEFESVVDFLPGGLQDGEGNLTGLPDLFVHGVFS